MKLHRVGALAAVAVLAFAACSSSGGSAAPSAAASGGGSTGSTTGDPAQAAACKSQKAASGSEIHAALMRSAEQKNKLFTAGIDRRDLEHLKRLVDHLIANSREILRREQELSGEGFDPDATPDA